MGIKSEIQIENPKPVYHTIVDFEQYRADDECCICLERLGRDVYKLQCGHAFHIDCIREWIKSNNIQIEPFMRRFGDMSQGGRASGILAHTHDGLFVMYDMTNYNIWSKDDLNILICMTNKTCPLCRYPIKPQPIIKLSWFMQVCKWFKLCF